MATRMYASKSNRDKSKEILRALALVDARLKGVESMVAAIEAAHWQPKAPNKVPAVLQIYCQQSYDLMTQQALFLQQVLCFGLVLWTVVNEEQDWARWSLYRCAGPLAYLLLTFCNQRSLKFANEALTRPQKAPPKPRQQQDVAQPNDDFRSEQNSSSFGASE